MYVRELPDEPDELGFAGDFDDALLDPLEFDRSEYEPPLLPKRFATAVDALKSMIDPTYISCFAFMVSSLPLFRVVISIEPFLICFNCIPPDRIITTQKRKKLLLYLK